MADEADELEERRQIDRELKARVPGLGQLWNARRLDPHKAVSRGQALHSESGVALWDSGRLLDRVFRWIARVFTARRN